MRTSFCLPTITLLFLCACGIPSNNNTIPTAIEEKLKAQEESFKNAQESYNSGVMTSFDFDQVRNRLVDAKSSMINAKYNFVFRSGINESDVLGSGQFPFYILSTYLDKRISHKSALQIGADVFFSNFLKEYIYYRSVAFPSDSLDPETDYKRVGIFAGHELFINKMSVVTQFGYYVYYPFDFEGRTYLRVGLKRYFGNKWFGAVTLKAHAAKAEAVELGIGIRL